MTTVSTSASEDIVIQAYENWCQQTNIPHHPYSDVFEYIMYVLTVFEHARIVRAYLTVRNNRIDTVVLLDRDRRRFVVRQGFEMVDLFLSIIPPNLQDERLHDFSAVLIECIPKDVLLPIQSALKELYDELARSKTARARAERTLATEAVRKKERALRAIRKVIERHLKDNVVTAGDVQETVRLAIIESVMNS